MEKSQDLNAKTKRSLSGNFISDHVTGFPIQNIQIIQINI